MACDTVLDSSIPENTYRNLTALYPANFSAVSQSWTTPASPAYLLCKARFKLYKAGSPTGKMVARLYAHSGTFGSSSVPTGAILAESDELDIESLDGTPTWRDFIFTGDNLYSLTENTYYCIVFALKSGVVNGSNYVRVRYNSADVHGGNYALRFNGWLVYSGYDIAFYVYGEEEAVFIPIHSIVSLAKVLDVI